MSLRQIWSYWALLTSFFFGMYFFRVAPSALSEYLMHYFQVSLPQMSLLTSCFFITYTISQVPVGYALGRFPVKNLMIFALFICAASAISFTYAPNFILACLATTLYAAFASFAFVGAVTYAKAHFPSQWLPLAVSLTQTAGMLGGFVGKNIVMALTIHYSWTVALSVIAALLVTLATLIALFVPATPVEREQQPTTSEVPRQQEISLYRQKKTWFTAVYAGMIFLPMYSFAESVGEPMISTIHQISLKETTFAISMAYVGWIFGGPLAGIAADLYGRLAIMRASAVCGLLATLSLISFSLPYWALCSLFFFYGFTNTGLSACYTVASEMFSQKQSSLSVAIANMFTNIFGAIFIPLLSSALNVFCTPELIAGVPKYLPEAYQYTFIVLALAPMIAYLCTYFIPETMKPKERSA